MEELKQQILKQGVIVSDQVLNLDSILNHQIDPSLIMSLGKQFAERFKDEPITKVVTIESSGISVGFAAALELGVPLLFARRKKTLTTGQEVYSERVPSFTKGIVTDIVISKAFLQPHDKVLLIDDIIANGDAAKGLIKIIEVSGANLVGIGIVIEKAFQTGASSIREQGYRLESLVKITSLEHGNIELE